MEKGIKEKNIRNHYSSVKLNLERGCFDGFTGRIMAATIIKADHDTRIDTGHSNFTIFCPRIVFFFRNKGAGKPPYTIRTF